MLSREEAYRFLLACLPPGSEWHYDLEDDPGAYFYAIAQVVKDYGLDAVENLRLELNPATATEKIPDWEEFLGLSYSRTALYGTLRQRRNQVVGNLRAIGEGFSLPGLRSIAQMFVDYADPTQIRIIETDRAALKVLHTLQENPALVLGANSSTTRTFNKNDTARVSPAGAQLELAFAGGNPLDEISVTLTGPDGFSKVWSAGCFQGAVADLSSLHLYAPEFYGHAIRGTWTMKIKTGSFGVQYQEALFFVEGLGRDQLGNDGLGSAMFVWAFGIDPLLLGGDAELEGLRLIIPRIKPAHTIGQIVRKNEVMGGAWLAIPDDMLTIPDESIPG